MKYHYHFDPTDTSTAARLCRLVGHNKIVLELGCAAGAMSQVLKEHYGCRITGIEYDAEAAELARPFCEQLHVANLDHTPASELVGEQRFNVVLMADVIEHLRDPQAQLQDVRGLLQPNGLLVISIPNVAHNGLIAQLLCGQFNYTATGLLDNTHIRFFTAHSLNTLLEQEGFKVLHTEGVNTDQHHPEFAQYWQALPADIHAYLEQNVHGHAYQIITVAMVA